MFCFVYLDEHFDNVRSGISSFDNMNKNENEVLLECSEDVPFSPLRQSYTPLPMNQSNGNDMDDNVVADNEVHIIDIKLNGREILQANDDEQDDDNENVAMNKEDVVVFTIREVNDGKSHSHRLTVLGTLYEKSDFRKSMMLFVENLLHTKKCVRLYQACGFSIESKKNVNGSVYFDIISITWNMECNKCIGV